MASSPTFRTVRASMDSVVWASLPVAAGGHLLLAAPAGDQRREVVAMFLATALLGLVGLLGVGYRLLDGLFRPDVDYSHPFLLIALFPTLVKHEKDIVALLARLPAAFLVAGVAARIANRSQA